MFIVYIASILNSRKIIIYLLQKTLIALLNIKKIYISIKYFDFIYVFLFDFMSKLSEYTNINNN